ncbi:MAG: hypothetical protein J0L62_05175 [Bacteroidetes bacterium]|nr:hypothetical protein [Bacteroidota bacterium]
MRTVLTIASICFAIIIGTSCDKDEDDSSKPGPDKVNIGKHQTTLGDFPSNHYANEVALVVGFTDDIGSSYAGYLQFYDKLTWKQNGSSFVAEFKPSDLNPEFEGNLSMKILITDVGQSQSMKMTQTGENENSVLLTDALTFEGIYTKDAKSGSFKGYSYTSPTSSYIWGSEDWTTNSGGTKTGTAKYWDNSTDSTPDIVEYELNQDKTGIVIYKPNGVKKFYARWFINGSGEITYYDTAGNSTGTYTWPAP